MSAFRKFRDPTTQGAFPLRGKFINVTELQNTRVIQNQEVKDLLTAIGLKMGEPPKELRYGKVLIYSDASMEWGFGAVAYFPARWLAVFFRIPVSDGTSIEVLEVEAAALGELVFAPIMEWFESVHCLGFIDNNVSLPWITAGGTMRGKAREQVNAMIVALWMSIARRRAFTWWERVSRVSNPADAPSRGEVPACPRGWRLVELRDVVRWDPLDDAAGCVRAAPDGMEWW